MNAEIDPGDGGITRDVDRAVVRMGMKNNGIGGHGTLSRWLAPRLTAKQIAGEEGPEHRQHGRRSCCLAHGN